MALLLLVLACTGTPEDTGPTCTDEERLVNWENFGAGFFAGYCRTCHSAGTPDRLGAPVGVDFDTEADVYTHRAAIRRTTLDDATRPMGGGVQTAELEALDVFLECGL